jgi:hypothetical protein
VIPHHHDDRDGGHADHDRFAHRYDLPQPVHPGLRN